jgi:hypothetical protein
MRHITSKQSFGASLSYQNGVNMYNTLMITKGGKLTLFTDTGAPIEVKGDLPDYLAHDCVFEPGLKFIDLVSLVEPYAAELSYVLTQGPWLPKFITEARKPFVSNPDMQFLSIGWCCELNNYGTQDELTEYPLCRGLGVEEYALDFSPLNKLTELELKLDTTAVLYDMRDMVNKNPMVPGVLYKAHKSFTLLDILRGVFWELSFHGDPDDRDKRAEELNDLCARIDSGEVEMIPFEDIKRHFEDEQEED